MVIYGAFPDPSWRRSIQDVDVLKAKIEPFEK
jgi:hypothetical protein